MPDDLKLGQPSEVCPRCGSGWVAAVVFSQKFRWPVSNWMRCDRCGHLFMRSPEGPTLDDDTGKTGE